VSKERYNNLEKKKMEDKLIKNRNTIPQLVSVTLKNEDETDEQIIERQEKFLRLPEDVKDKLASHKTGEKIFKIGQNFGLDLQKTASIARMVRNYYFGEVKKEDFVKVLAKETGINENDAGKIVEIVLRTIIDDKSLGVNVSIIELKLEDALKKFPEIGEQIISRVSLKGGGFSDMLRPTIRNWIKDYYQEMGTGKHDLMQRGDYLYHSKNTKGVSEVERQKLMTIIKSLEDGTLLKIDEQQKEIVFDAYKESQKVDIKSSFKDNFHKKPLFNFLQKKEITLVEEEKKEEDRKNSKSGMEKINKKIQEEATVSSGYFLQKKENKPQEVIKRQMEVKKIEIDKVEAPKKNVVFNQMETMNNNENKIQKKQKDEEKESPYIIKPLSMESNKKRRSDFDISSNVIDLRK